MPTKVEPVRETGRHGWGRRGAVVLVVAAALLAIASAAAIVWPGSLRALVATGQTRDVPMRASGAMGDFSLSFSVRFDSPRTILRGTFALPGRGVSSDAGFYDNALTDDDWVQQTPMHAGAGDDIEVHARGFLPPCGTAIKPPVVEVTSSLWTGREIVDRFQVANPGEYRAAVRSWCRKPLQTFVEGGRFDHHGSSSLVLMLVNPGPSAVRVRSQRLAYGRTVFRPATVVVPPSTRRRLTVHAIGYREGGQTPWTRGRFLGNGQPLIVHSRL